MKSTDWHHHLHSVPNKPMCTPMRVRDACAILLPLSWSQASAHKLWTAMRRVTNITSIQQLCSYGIRGCPMLRRSLCHGQNMNATPAPTWRHHAGNTELTFAWRGRKCKTSSIALKGSCVKRRTRSLMHSACRIIPKRSIYGLGVLEPFGWVSAASQPLSGEGRRDSRLQ